jgi:hypothetical protein
MVKSKSRVKSKISKSKSKSKSKVKSKSKSKSKVKSKSKSKVKSKSKSRSSRGYFNVYINDLYVGNVGRKLSTLGRLSLYQSNGGKKFNDHEFKNLLNITLNFLNSREKREINNHGTFTEIAPIYKDEIKDLFRLYTQMGIKVSNLAYNGFTGENEFFEDGTTVGILESTEKFIKLI